MRKITKFQTLQPLLSQNSKERHVENHKISNFYPLRPSFFFAETAKGIAQHFALNC